jgi:D-amino-acid dehydrogenase
MLNGQTLSADYVVVAAGAWSDALARSIGDKVLLESERGYNTTIPAEGVKLSREVIFTESKFVAAPLSIGLRIGGAAEIGGLQAAAIYERSEALVKQASLYLPAEHPSQWRRQVGHRPTTPDSLPVIGASPRSKKSCMPSDMDILD